jgi:hypothetical protein
MRSHVRADDKIAAKTMPDNGESSLNGNPGLSRDADVIRRIAFGVGAVEAL